MNKQDYELEYWMAVRSLDFSHRYKTILETFKIQGNQGVAMDFGCGMFSGVLPYIEADVKYAYDPLGKEFQKLRNNNLYPPIHTDLPPDEMLFDNIFCINVIDHDDMDFRMLHYFKSKLKRKGNLYLNVDLRTKEQLNEGHDHQLTVEQYGSELWKSNFTEVWRKVETNIFPEPSPASTSSYLSITCKLTNP